MGKQGRFVDHRKERDDDLLGAYKKQLHEAGYPFLLLDVVSKTVNSPAKRFWVSPERAMMVISQLERGNSLAGMKRNKQRMFLEIYRRVRQLRKQPNYKNACLTTLVSIVVDQPAPCFYMTPQSAVVIMHKIRKCKRNLPK